MPHRKRHEEDPEQPPNEPQAALPDETVDQQQELITELEAKLKEANDERLRAIADFQNFRRRTQQEMTQFRQLAAEGLVSALLPVIDNFERTVHHLEAGADAETMLTAIRAVEKHFKGVLQGQNLKRIPSVGEPFDPELHEAVGIAKSEEHPDETVVEEFEPGYRLGDRVIRPARVRVARST